MAMAEPLLQRNFHPTVIVSGYCKALQKALEVCKQISRVIDVDNIKVRGERRGERRERKKRKQQDRKEKKTVGQRRKQYNRIVKKREE